MMMMKRPRSLPRISEEDSEDDFNNNICLYNCFNPSFPNYQKKIYQDGLDNHQPSSLS